MSVPKDFKNPKFTPMCVAVGNQKTERFPLELPFPNGQAAQSFRCEFYAYRRALKSQLDKAGFSPDLHVEYEGAKALEIARVDYSQTPSILTIRLRTQRPTFQEAFNVLDGLFEQEPAQAQELTVEEDDDTTPVPVRPSILHTIKTPEGIYSFETNDDPLRSDSTYLLLIKRNSIEAMFTPS